MVDHVQENHTYDGLNTNDAATLLHKYGGAVDILEGDALQIEGEPHGGIEFECHEAAYSFYQEYAKSMGFTTSIKNSRRSKKSKEFIDAKFACSRYGISPEPDCTSSRRPTLKKTNCKASMHVKKRPGGKWVVYSFVKEHNHELLPALAYHFRIHKNVKVAEKNNIDILHAVSERTRKMYVEMSRHSSEFWSFEFLKTDTVSQFDRGLHLALDVGDAQFILEYFKHVKKDSPGFLYAIDLNEEHRLRNLFWVDAKSRSDYSSFSDVISLESCYIKNNNKMPFVPFVGVNNHFQPILLGCALVADDSKSTFVWLMKTWLRAMGGLAPKVIITDHDQAMKMAVEEVFSTSCHCFSLHSILEKASEILIHVIQCHPKFLQKFNKCIFKSWTEEDFDMRWWKMIGRFELQEYEWIRLLYDHRKKWVPTYMKGTFLGGMCPIQRSESMSAFLDRYIHKKITLKEFVRQYGTILHNIFEDEALADFDTWHKQPALKSPSPWEKQVSALYTHAIFKKFQVEVLGVVGCHIEKVGDDGTTVTFKVQDCEKNERFYVAWIEAKSEVYCSCRSFEYRGFLCRHAMIVLQICGFSSIPSQYILTRWTKDAKSMQSSSIGAIRVEDRIQRYNYLCKRAIELCEEGSLSQDNYSVAIRFLVEALKNCVNENDSNKNVGDSNNASILKEHHGSLAFKRNKKRNPNKKRRALSETEFSADTSSNLHQMEHLGTDVMTLSGLYGTQQNVPLNLMEPPHDAYYINQQSLQGLLTNIASGHDIFFGPQQSTRSINNLDFRVQANFTYGLQENTGSSPSHVHGSSSGRA
uniref:Protein FAR1-RELATED SEQUENCE n=1 Tax=Kalanchoe fedtschenkoi TaxID=63787 RepID=A0A7N0TF99_KALFE